MKLQAERKENQYRQNRTEQNKTEIRLGLLVVAEVQYNIMQ